MTMLFIWLVLAFLGLSVVSHRVPLIFPFAHLSQIHDAYKMGVEARLNLSGEINDNIDDMTRMERFAHHFMSCSAVGSDLQVYFDNLLKERPKHLPDDLKRQRILRLAGFDIVSSLLFTMRNEDIEKTITAACLKNELQLQCAFGFLNDFEKIEEHISELKKADGNLKIMFERECKNPQESPKLYSCIGRHVHFVKKQCLAPLEQYIHIKTTVDVNIDKLSRALGQKIETVLAEDEESSDDDILVHINGPIHSTLAQVSSLEDLKCSVFNELSTCFVHHMSNYCGRETIDVLNTVLRVGYMKRERDEQLQHQFEQLDIPPSPNCISLV